MAFQLERFDVVKQHYDGTGLFIYHDTVGAGNTDPTSGKAGDAIATIAAEGFFNTVADQLAIGSVIIVATTAAVKLYVVTGVVDKTTNKPKVVLTAAA